VNIVSSRWSRIGRYGLCSTPSVESSWTISSKSAIPVAVSTSPFSLNVTNSPGFPLGVVSVATVTFRSAKYSRNSSATASSALNTVRRFSCSSTPAISSERVIRSFAVVAPSL